MVAAFVTGLLAIGAWLFLDQGIAWNQLLVVGACLIHLLVSWFVLWRTAAFCRFSTSKKRIRGAMLLAASAVVGITVVYGLAWTPVGTKLAEHVPMIAALTFMLPGAIMCWSLQHMSRRIAAEIAWGRWE